MTEALRALSIGPTFFSEFFIKRRISRASTSQIFLDYQRHFYLFKTNIQTGYTLQIFHFDIKNAVTNVCPGLLPYNLWNPLELLCFGINFLHQFISNRNTWKVWKVLNRFFLFERNGLHKTSRRKMKLLYDDA